MIADASGSRQRSVVLPSNDKKVLNDYKAFRQARAQIHIKQREWHGMSKKTKRALVAMFAALARQHSDADKILDNSRLQRVLAMLADRIESQKHSYHLAHSGLATHVFETIAKEIRAVAKELNP